MKIENIVVSNININNNSATLTFDIVELEGEVNVNLKVNDGEFKRLVGVPRPLFLKMVSVLQHAELAKKKSGKRCEVHYEKNHFYNFNFGNLILQHCCYGC